jgi:hypothetical protein
MLPARSNSDQAGISSASANEHLQGQIKNMVHMHEKSLLARQLTANSGRIPEQFLPTPVRIAG